MTSKTDRYHDKPVYGAYVQSELARLANRTPAQQAAFENKRDGVLSRMGAKLDATNYDIYMTALTTKPFKLTEFYVGLLQPVHPLAEEEAK